MTILRTTLAAAAFGLAAFAAPATPRAEKPVPAKKAKAPGDVIDMAVADGRFTVLAKAIQAAGLIETLKGAGPFTVFAPTDAAFAKLPPGTVEGLLADKAKLTAVLTYHVVPGKLMAADVAMAKSLKTVQGGSLTVDASRGVKINDATVIVADLAASNGVIHAIDTVVLPR